MPTHNDTERQIRQFLEDHPSGKLVIGTGFLSIWGLAWLSRNTTHSPVVLLTGNAESSYFNKGTQADRAEAIRFLQRDDVQVKNLYSKKTNSQFHAKVWVVDNGDSVSAINGSANLSKSGLQNNFEMITSVSAEETDKVYEHLEASLTKAWNCKSRVLGYITGGGSGRQANDTGESALTQFWKRLTGRQKALVVIGFLVALGLLASLWTVISDSPEDSSNQLSERSTVLLPPQPGNGLPPPANPEAEAGTSNSLLPGQPANPATDIASSAVQWENAAEQRCQPDPAKDETWQELIVKNQSLE